MRKQWFLLVTTLLLLISACSSDDPAPPGGPPGVIPPPGTIPICKVNEIEIRDENDDITGIREFKFDVNKNNRLESVSIVEDIGSQPLNLRFEFKYGNETTEVPASVDEVFGGDIVTSIDFTYDADGNLTEYLQNQVLDPSIPPQSHIFFYEESELANDSVNTRIITFDINNLTRDWIDVFPALFTTGGKRITRFDRVTFRGDLLEFCEFSYDDDGLLTEIVCRTADFVLSEVWNFTYDDERLSSAFWQLPNFRALSDYTYDNDGKPIAFTSSTNGFFNWKGAYFYQCR